MHCKLNLGVSDSLFWRLAGARTGEAMGCQGEGRGEKSAFITRTAESIGFKVYDNFHLGIRVIDYVPAIHTISLDLLVRGIKFVQNRLFVAQPYL